MFKSLGPMELVIILLIIVMIFGVGKLPQVASSIGKSLKAFKEGQTQEEEAEAAVSRPRRKQARPAKAGTTTTKKAAKKPAAAPTEE
jgi:sec-independent protein translocase protein TatA